MKLNLTKIRFNLIKQNVEVWYLNGEKTGNSTSLKRVNKLRRKTKLGNIKFVFTDGNRSMAKLVVGVVESKTLEGFLRGEDRSVGGGNSRDNEGNCRGFVVRTETEKGVETGSGVVEWKGRWCVEKLGFVNGRSSDGRSHFGFVRGEGAGAARMMDKAAHSQMKQMMFF